MPTALPTTCTYQTDRIYTDNSEKQSYKYGQEKGLFVYICVCFHQFKSTKSDLPLVIKYSKCRLPYFVTTQSVLFSLVDLNSVFSPIQSATNPKHFTLENIKHWKFDYCSIFDHFFLLLTSSSSPMTIRQKSFPWDLFIYSCQRLNLKLFEPWIFF